jgi:hypothetical protein
MKNQISLECYVDSLTEFLLRSGFDKPAVHGDNAQEAIVHLFYKGVHIELACKVLFDKLSSEPQRLS